MDTFRVESVLIQSNFERAFRYIAEPQNLPQWAHAFQSVGNGRALMATPDGTAEVALKVNSSSSEGTVDWRMTFSDGSVAVAYSRLVSQSSDACIYSFVLLSPPVPLERLEGALNRQAERLRSELKKLSEILCSA